MKCMYAYVGFLFSQFRPDLCGKDYLEILVSFSGFVIMSVFGQKFT